ncbi:winged helix-turn-helix domain-containing protein [Arthrobacter sp. Leaf141]|uniref:winged helix-turn-helix domain-containing protein n=1 Tax=Arthrobacter sp. Leaf141 TaxID=1736273 RepID=UPI000A97A537|nr:winged helix-turn-helix domain-containing protein [Arthrobacter sp. Leaf141]
MATATETLKATLSDTEYRTLVLLAGSMNPRSGREIASELKVAPTTANGALAKLSDAGFADSKKSGRAILWQLAVSNPLISAWLEEVAPAEHSPSQANGSSPYSTGGGGVRLEHSYAACLIASFLGGGSISELGDAVSVNSIRLQASDLSEVDDLLLEGSDAHGRTHRASIAVRRNPALTDSDTASVPLIRDFLTVVTDHWPEASSGLWHLVLAVSTSANAITQLAELAELARSLPNGEELAQRLTQSGRTNAGVRGRYAHIQGLVRQAATGLPTARGLSSEELTWRLLSTLRTRSLRLERTDREDRTAAVNALQRMLSGGTPAMADALFSRIEELVGQWAPQAAVLTQSEIRRSLSNYPLLGSARYASTWAAFDRFGVQLRESIRPALRSGTQELELNRTEERTRLLDQMRTAGASAGSLVVTGDPDVGKSALSLRAAEAIQREGGAVTSLSLRDLPLSVSELESQLGGHSLDEVMGAGPVRPIRLLLIDGAESVLEGKAQVFRTVAGSALRAGVGVVAVTRTDGSRQVRDELARACELAGLRSAPAEHVVMPLTASECDELPATFLPLARLASDPRAKWLLGRPGLVDALLRTGVDLDPGELLCEADVFSTVWRNLIRHNEVHVVGSASPDDREQAALRVARQTLGVPADSPHGLGPAELRSVGVLRMPNNPAFAPGDEFTTDLFRDFALCRLFITNGWDLLAAAGAPRWSIRSARLGCQTALLNGNRLASWTALTAQFRDIGEEQGKRWLEIPYEALLTLGDAEAAVRELWEILTGESYAPLLTLLRLAEARYVSGTIGDPFALAPLVKVVFAERPQLGRRQGLGNRDLHEVIRELVLAWLRGMATSNQGQNRLRQEVRDVILAGDPPLYDEFTIEALATLGPDLDDRAEAWLRTVAKERPGSLDPAVESIVVAVSMSQAKPNLLLDLAEAYYIELPDPDEHWTHSHLMDDGIRDYRHGLGPGFGSPQAAWYYGPFFRLLNAIPAEAIGLINRMLDHAAKFRVGERPTDQIEGNPEGLEGVEFDLPATGRRLFVGDSHVWAWYRGTSVGPYACMSALLAVERFADHLHEVLKLPVETILRLLLRDCHNLAIPGLVVGFLTRHPDEARTLLDPFLASPAVWHLETARVTSDYGFRVRDADADKLTGSDRRRYTFHETVGSMVVNARLAGDNERLDQLRALGTKLLENARAEQSDASRDGDDIAVIESWAEEFRIENYSASESGDQILIQFERPERIEQVLAPRTAELQKTNTLYSLQNRYAHHNDAPENWPVENIQEDLKTAREIDDGSETLEGILWPENALVAVAAAAVRAHALGLEPLKPSDLAWAADAVMWAAENPRVDGMSFSGTMFSMGADRAAAASAPLLLLERFDEMSLDQERVQRCLRSLATSMFDEVRAIFVKGCAPVWGAQCDVDQSTGRCRRHQPVWEAAVMGLADSLLGPWDQQTQRRRPGSLSTPFHETLPELPDESLLVNHLRMPLACMVDARNVACIHSAVQDLWAPLWDAHRRGLAHWWKEGYDHHSHITHDPVARRMIEVVLGGDRGPIRSHIESFAADSNALHLLFDGFATVFTYNESLRQSMPQFWPWAMEIALDAIGDGSQLRSQRHWFDYLTAALLPTPSPRSWDSNIDGTLARCRQNWLQPEALGPLADRWLVLARHEPKAVDAIIKFAKGAPRTWQITIALTWIEKIIDGRFDLVANHLWLFEEWLVELRHAGLIIGEVKSHYHRIVDGLAAAGDRAAVRLQQLDE